MQTYTTYFFLLLRWGIVGVRIGREWVWLVWRANEQNEEARTESWISLWRSEWQISEFDTQLAEPRVRSVFIGHTNLSKRMFFISLATIEFSFWLAIKYIPLCGFWAKRLQKRTKLWGMFLNLLHLTLFVCSMQIFCKPFFTVPN